MSALRKIINQSNSAIIAPQGSFRDPSTKFLNAVIGDMSDAGVKVSNGLAYNLSAYWRAINIIANDVAKLDKLMYDRKPNGERVLVEDDVYNLVAVQPNENQNQSAFWLTLINHLINWGNFYIYVKRDPFYNPIEFCIKYPWETTIYLTKQDRRKVFHFADEEGTGYVEQDSVIHCFRLSVDGIMGMNPIMYAAKNAIGLGLVSEMYQSKFFANGGRGNGVVEIDKDARFGDISGGEDEEEENEITRIRQSWEGTYNSVDSFFKTMFLDPGEKYKIVNTPPEALQLLNTRKFQVNEIARLVGLPAYKLAEQEPKHANIEQQSIEYVDETIAPIVRHVCDEIKIKCLPTGSTKYFKFDTSSLIRADLKTRYDAYSLGLGRNAPGFITPEWIQDKEDLPRFDADKLYVPQNMRKQSEPSFPEK